MMYSAHMMFSDTEVLTVLACDRETAAVTQQAQTIIDRQARQLAALQRQLASARATNARLRVDRGREGIEELLAIRALKNRRH